MNLQAPRGTKDILPGESCIWQEIEANARCVLSIYNYSEIRTPVFESLTLFKRSLGEETDIVQKQMFVFSQGDDQLVLRPEATASIARAYLEHNLGHGVKLRKLFYVGPMFRAERPQKGRLRQFHHIGVEAIGSTEPYLDVEILEVAQHLLKEWGISGHTFLINSLGCEKDKAALAGMLHERLSPHKKNLCLTCQERFSRNIFRVLDCKKEECKKIRGSIKFSHDYLCGSCRVSFDKILKGIEALKIPYRLEFQLVRGLDYYSGMVFEITHPNLGSQDAVGAGGRYDLLFKQLANKELGAIGFAFGIERIILAKQVSTCAQTLPAYCISIGEAGMNQSRLIARQLRDKAIRCDVDFSDSSLKSKLNEANRLGVEYVIIIGDTEIAQQRAVVRSMKDSKQEEVIFVQVSDYLAQRLKG